MRTNIHIFIIAGITSMFDAAGVAAAPPDTNYDESKVPTYTLPDPLVMNDGTPVADAEGWNTRRRPEILELFSKMSDIPKPPIGVDPIGSP